MPGRTDASLGLGEGRRERRRQSTRGTRRRSVSYVLCRLIDVTSSFPRIAGTGDVGVNLGERLRRGVSRRGSDEVDVETSRSILSSEA